MKKIERIEHEAVITAIDENYITVEIQKKSACAACHAKGVYVDVPYNISSLVENFQVGDAVNLVLSSSLGMKAVFISYAVPLMLLVFLLLFLYSLGLNELMIGLLSLGGVALYYLFIFLFRDKLERIFTFSIEKNNK